MTEALGETKLGTDCRPLNVRMENLYSKKPFFFNSEKFCYAF